MITRSQYIRGEHSHREYYSQFVDDIILDIVKNAFTLEVLKRAYQKDIHFNTISIRKWDCLGGILCVKSVTNKLSLCEDYLTNAGATCILKEAALQLVESKGN